jgi:hypothetical protein
MKRMYYKIFLTRNQPGTSPSYYYTDFEKNSYGQIIIYDHNGSKSTEIMSPRLTTCMSDGSVLAHKNRFTYLKMSKEEWDEESKWASIK